MSKYTGKCDFRDHLEIFFEDDFNMFMGYTKGKIYKVHSGCEPDEIEIKKPADLILYYPYVCAITAHNKIDQTSYIVLAEDSELERRSTYMDVSDKIDTLFDLYNNNQDAKEIVG